MKDIFVISQEFPEFPTKKNGLKIVKTFEEVLNDVGFGRVQIEIAFVVTLLLFTVLNETMGISFIIPAAQCDLNLTSTNKGILSGITFAGIMISSLFWGFFADTRGRRLTILIALIFSSSFSVISTFINNFALFLFCRFMTGIFVAGSSIALYAYVGEFNANKYRPAVMTATAVAIGLSAICQPLLAIWVLSYDWSYQIYDGFLFRPWRLLMFLYSFSGIIAGLWMLKFPESPRFLLVADRHDEALEVLNWMNRVNNKTDKKLEVTEIQSENVKSNEVKSKWQTIKNQIFPLLKPPHLWNFLACCLLLFGVFCVAGGVCLFFPDTLNQLAKSRENGTHEGLTLCEILQRKTQVQTSNLEFCDDSVDPSILIDSSYLGVGYLIGYISISAVISKLGRRKILATLLMISAISGFVLVQVTEHYLIVIFYSFVIVFGGMNVGVINSASVDLFPTHIRSMAVCISMLCGRFATSLSTYLIGLFIEDYCMTTYNVFAGFTLVLFFVSFILPDSK